jgi:peptidoglycan hydrolase-like protein with peptidoglycan-binding domain
MALQRVWIPSPNYSSRSGSVRLIVLHTAEGSKTYQSLGNYFASSSSGVSSHVGIDDTPGVVGEYVKRGNKAWTQGNANSVSVAAELCAFAAWTTADWNAHPTMLSNTAQWVAEEAAAFGIPLVRLTPSQAQGSGRGVCEHVDLGSWGGGHTDCGTAFPIDQVIAMAGGQPAPSPGPTPPPQPGGPAPPWPWGPSDYIGTPSPDPHCHSGHYGPPDSNVVAQWQGQMAHRGWSIGVDGDYGPQSQNVCRQFQSEKGLAVDGLVGPQTWGASWTAPIT